MNVYFLVEGRRCERKLYPSWLSYAAPRLKRVYNPFHADTNSYYLISAEGYPSILRDHLPNAVRDIEKSKQFDLLVVVLDADELSVEERRNEARESAAGLVSARLAVVVQNRCIETWLLGNRKLIKRNPQCKTLRNYLNHYDAAPRDPERMPVCTGFNTHSQFHFDYLRLAFRERGLAYTKARPGEAGEQHYFEELKRRVVDSPGDLATFADFVRLCGSL